MKDAECSFRSFRNTLQIIPPRPHQTHVPREHRHICSCLAVQCTHAFVPIPCPSSFLFGSSGIAQVSAKLLVAEEEESRRQRRRHCMCLVDTLSHTLQLFDHD
eukprot:2354577-Rhodomonas_salina.1